MSETHHTLTNIVREEAGRLASVLVRLTGDFAIAEELVQDAVLVALERWPTDGVPDRPGAWLLTVARRLGLNWMARQASYREKLAKLEAPETVEVEDRLRLIFTCCHPALAREAQVALTLRAVCGFTTEEIARSFVASEAAVAQRIARARRKIAEAGITYAMPRDQDLPARLDEVLAVLYLMFNEGYLTTAGMAARRDLTDDAQWLATLVCRLLPSETEPMGLLALMKLHAARASTRFDQHGELVLLRDQDRARWDRALIADAVALIERAGARRRVGPYQVEAAIAALHAEAPSFAATDWRQIAMLYDLLIGLAPSPVVHLHRAIAIRYTEGPEAALAETERLVGLLDGYHLFHATRGELLFELGEREHARAAQARALALTQNQAERSLLRQRLFR